MVDVPGLGKMSKADAEGLAYIQSKDRGKYIDEKLSKHDLGKHTTDKMNEKQFNAIEQVSRLNTVADAFDPKFLTLGETVKQAKLSWQEYLTGSIPPESEADRSKYVTFQQSTLNNLNKYIQEMTGAAMSDGEAARLKAAMPNMNMDPTQFKTALNNVRSQSLLAIARYNYLRDTQFKGKAWDAKEVENHTSIDGMRKIIHDRRDQLLKDIRSEYPKANEADVQNAVKARIGRQFGIDA